MEDESGNILQPGGRWDVLAAVNKALAEIGEHPRLSSGIYSGVIVVDGPSVLGKRPYSVYLSRQVSSILAITTSRRQKAGEMTGHCG